MSGLDRRLQAFMPSDRRRCLMVDTSAGLALGTLPGLEDFSAAVRPVLPKVDGLVCSPGQVGRLGALQKSDAAVLVRMDWNNTLRRGDFVLPATQPRRVPILAARDALDLGAAGMVTTFLLGYEEEIEAACLKSAVQLALDGNAIGLPLVVEVQPTGERVSLPGKAVELGASYALESGADVIVIPYPGHTSLQTIARFVSVPWLIRPTMLEPSAPEIQDALTAGAAGLWLDHACFAHPDAQAVLQAYQPIRHGRSELA